MIAFVFSVPVQAETITVCPNGGDYTSIQDAINNANPGDVIEVCSGTYYENVVVNKPVILRGVDTGGGKPVVDASRIGNAITITADGVAVDGFVVKNSGKYYSGIWIESDNTTISNNNISDNWFGIWVIYSSYNTIYNNTIENNGDGIDLMDDSSNNIVYNNRISKNNWVGIYLSGCQSNKTSLHLLSLYYCYILYCNWRNAN